ncbi:histidine phosphatase family protein [Marinomonas balearica]|uniref:phosphoglycerate mutase (2,3-diphosphoglycerate-dependent) n=1 Tax=Marinomonas balearica TaxID=491947 RepID=A0A4R6MBH4_9GAMM|nr:phosphoglycerate mutase family protein [Marinomonas balearica]TDO98951.1 2,3-bisphosphoglycerate-dependent phosphoglycerate mutase [Marinomonas balearica]
MKQRQQTRCALIRHGAYEQLKNVPSALQPFPLTEEGEKEVRHQARLFGEWLKESGNKLNPVVDSSSLLRAWQTASIYIEELNDFFVSEPVLTGYPELCERSVGAVANLPIAEIERLLALDPRFGVPPENWKSDSYYKLPFDGAESLIEAGQRVADHIAQWQNHVHDDEKMNDPQLIKLFVGHGASIRHAAFHLNVINFCDIKRLSMYYGHPVVFEFVKDKHSTKLFGDWKKRQIQEVPD